jgi:membrane protein
MLSPKTIAKCFYQALVDTINHDGIEHAGYLAFLAILSLFPFLVFFVAIAGFLGQTDVGLKLIHIILANHLIPSNIMPGLEPRINEIASGPPQGILTLSIIGAIWTASSAVDGLRTILNRAYRVSTPPAYIFRRLMSIAEFIIITAILILVTFLLIIAPNILDNLKHLLRLEKLQVVMESMGFYINNSWDYLRYIISTIILFLLVAVSYILLPNTKQSWRSVAPGAAVVIIAWFFAGSLFSMYLSDFPQVNIIYGSLGGIIAALLFFYITAMIYIYGAELNYLLEKAQGHEIKEKVYKKKIKR